MRRTLFLAALLFAAPAQAATSLPAATEPGISASRLTGGSYLVKFTQTAYKGVAARDFNIVCFNPPARLGGSGPPKRSVTHLRRLPIRHASVRVKPSPGDNVCAFVRGEATPADADFLIALTTSGRRWLADFRTSAEVGTLLLSARAAGGSAGAWPTYSQLPERARRLAADLPSPGATPRGKAVGYYSDGKQSVTITGISASGARLVFAMNGDDAAANTPVVTNAIAPPSEPSGQLPV